jgi:hypothetical protein
MQKYKLLTDMKEIDESGRKKELDVESMSFKVA